MALPTVANTMKVAINGVLSGQECITVLHFKSPGSVSESLMDNLATDVELWLASLKDVCCNFYSVSSITVTDLSSTSGMSKTYTFATITGTAGGSDWPTNSALVITKRTDLRGRSFRGRSYFGAIPSDQAASNTEISTTYLSALLAVFAELLVSSSFHSCVLSVVSYFANKVQRALGVATPVTALTADTKFDSQRRRLAGRGA